MRKQNIYEKIPDKLDEELFENILKTESFTMKRIVSYGHSSPKSGWYEQDDNEWVIVLKGRAVLTYEDNETIELESGDYVNIPAYTKHKVSWTDPNVETVWIAVHY